VKAAVLEQVPGRPVIAHVDVAEPRGSEVLVAVAAAGVCHSELHFMHGHWTTPLPSVLGHEASGRVVAVGDRVTEFAPGDHVVAVLTPFCGSCRHCLAGRQTLCRSAIFARAAHEPPRLSRDGSPVHQFVNLGAFAERMLVHENALAKLPVDFPLDKAALLGCAVITGAGAVFNTARVEPGASVAVVGCGGVGLNAVQAARIAGATRIVAVDVNPRKLEWAAEFGATDLVDGSRQDAVASVRALTGGEGVDHALECVGAVQAAEDAWRMLGRGGTATIVGMLPEGARVSVLGTDFIDEKRLQGSNMGSTRFRTDVVRYTALYADGRLLLDQLISARIRLEDLDAAYDALEAGETARSLVVL